MNEFMDCEAWPVGAPFLGMPGKYVTFETGATAEDKSRDLVTTRDYGSLGDGSGRRLSSTYVSLEQAQVKYPNARSLNDTFDVVGIEKALLLNPHAKAPAGNYVINRSICVPSNTDFYGDGWTTVIRCTADMPRYMHMVVNKSGDYIGEGKTYAELQSLIAGNTGNSNFSIRNMWLIGDLEETKLMTRSAICLKHAKHAKISGVRTSWTGYHGIDISDASEGHIVNMPEYFGKWETKPSEDILVEGCFVEYHGDDGYTTHYSTDITFRSCVARFGSQIFSAENGFEVDDGSRNIVLDGCWAIREQAGFVVKCHDTAQASYNVTITNCHSQLCGYGFWFYGKQNITIGTYAKAYSVLMQNCSSQFTRRQELIWGRTHRDLLIQDYSGVMIDGFTVLGWNVVDELKPTDISDYQPFWKNSNDEAFRVTPDMMPYAEKVYNDGVDVTLTTSANIIVEKNARGISMNNVVMIGCQATLNHINIGGISDGVRGVTLSNMKFINCSGGAPIFSASDAAELSIDHVYAESKYAVSAFPVVRCSAVSSAFANIDLNDIRFKNYQRPYTFGSNPSDPIRPYASVKQPSLFVTDGDKVPLGASIPGIGVVSEYAVYYDVKKQDYIGANSFAHMVTTGNAQWFGQGMDGSYVFMWGVAEDGTFQPFADNLRSLGKAGARPSTIFAATGVINTSDERLKQQFRSVVDAEKAAALEIKATIGMFKFNDAVDEKGDAARWHVGVKAQQVVSILESHDLNPFDYGFVCYDEWEESETGPAGSQYAIRYDELIMFILSAM